MNRHHRASSEHERACGDAGASLVEYVLLISLIALVCFAALSAFGVTNSDSINDSASSIVNAG